MHSQMAECVMSCYNAGTGRKGRFFTLYGDLYWSPCDNKL